MEIVENVVLDQETHSEHPRDHDAAGALKARAVTAVHIQYSYSIILIVREAKTRNSERQSSKFESDHRCFPFSWIRFVTRQVARNRSRLRRSLFPPRPPGPKPRSSQHLQGGILSSVHRELMLVAATFANVGFHLLLLLLHPFLRE